MILKRLSPLLIIVTCEWLATTLWFASSSVIPEITLAWNSGHNTGAMLTTAVQLGFVAGTIFSVISRLADKVRASRLFAVSALLGALVNYCFALYARDVEAGIIWRFLTGFFMAGVYPIGMKLIVGWGPEQRGLALSWLVGALTLGTATPHLIAALAIQFQWTTVVKCASIFAIISACLIYRLGDGPVNVLEDSEIANQKTLDFDRKKLLRIAIGYFGHMWELYAFWAMVPFLIRAASSDFGERYGPITAFGIIGVGAIGCILGGYYSQKLSSLSIARSSLAVSATMCFLFPFFASNGAVALSIGCLFVWGFFVIADSPHFSSLTTKYSSNQYLGSVLTAQNSLGFVLTVGSIHLTTLFQDDLFTVCWILVPGPLLGLIAITYGWSEHQPHSR